MTVITTQDDALTRLGRVPFERIDGDLDAARQLQLAQHIANVDLDGAFGEIEFARDATRALARCLTARRCGWKAAGRNVLRAEQERTCKPR